MKWLGIAPAAVVAGFVLYKIAYPTYSCRYRMTVDVEVKSVSPIGSNAALVRFDTVQTDSNGHAQPPSPFVAVIKYRYSTAPMSVEDRFVNPLGFQVTSYRKDPEALPRADSNQQPAPSVEQSAVGVQPYYGATGREPQGSTRQ